VFNTWQINSAGLPGCLPCNNALEKLNQGLKGTKDVRKLIIPRRPMATALAREFTKAIHHLSLDKVGVTSDLLINNERLIMNQQSGVNNEMMAFNRDFHAPTDCLKIASGDRAVWYVNTFSHLGSGIKKTWMEKYEDAYISTKKLSYDKRHEFVASFESLCKVTVIRHHRHHSLEREYMGSCFGFFHDTWCCHAAALQFKDQLSKLAKEIPTRRTSKLGKSSRIVYQNPVTADSLKQMKNIEHKLRLVVQQIITEERMSSPALRTLVNDSNMLIGFIRTSPSKSCAISISNRINLGNVSRCSTDLKGYFQSGGYPEESKVLACARELKCTLKKLIPLKLKGDPKIASAMKFA
jgi:hypothetical protein